MARAAIASGFSRRFATALETRIRIFRGDLTDRILDWRFAEYAHLVRTTDSVHSLRGVAQSQIRKKLPERESARHARSGAAWRAALTMRTVCGASARYHGRRRGTSQPRSGNRRCVHRLEPLRLRSVRPHQEILRAHGAGIAAGRIAHRISPQHCAGRQPPTRNDAIRYGPRVCVSRGLAGVAVSLRPTGSISFRWTTLRNPSSHCIKNRHPAHEIYHLSSGTGSETFGQLTRRSRGIRRKNAAAVLAGPRSGTFLPS